MSITRRLRVGNMGQSAIGGLLSVLALIVVGLLVYSNNYQGEFIFDDFPAIVDNPDIRTLSRLGSILNPPPDGGPLAGRPVPSFLVALNYAFGGLNVWGYHLVNNLIHIVAALVLFGIVRRTLLLPSFLDQFGNRINVLALAVSMLWLVHPLQTEAVNYVTQRTETMMGLFYLLTLYCCIRGFSSGRRGLWSAWAIAASAFGMASKEVMVSAPLLVLLYDYLFVAGSFTKALSRRKILYAGLAATWLIILVYQLNDPRAGSVHFDMVEVSVLDYFRTQCTIIVHYLQLSVWPHPLVLDSQDWPIVRSFSAGFLGAFVFLAGLGAVTLFGIWRRRWWALLGAWFFAILAPSSSVVPILTEIVAERRMYLPLAAVVVLLVFSFDAGWQRVCQRIRFLSLWVQKGPVLVFFLVFSVLSWQTWERNVVYRSAVSIWSDSIAKRPGNSRAHENLAKALARDGRTAEAVGPYQEAIRLYPKEGLVPELADIYGTYGSVLSQLGRFEEALESHKKALELLPDDPLGHYHLGNSYLRTNDLLNAESSFRKALELNPDLPPAHGNLGLLLMQKGKNLEAEKHFKKLLVLAPQDPTGYSIYANFLDRQGRVADAVQLLQQALGDMPDSREIQGYLNALLKRRNEPR